MCIMTTMIMMKMIRCTERQARFLVTVRLRRVCHGATTRNLGSSHIPNLLFM